MVPRAHVGTPLAGSKGPGGLPRALDGLYAVWAVLDRRRRRIRAISRERDVRGDARASQTKALDEASFDRPRGRVGTCASTSAARGVRVSRRARRTYATLGGRQRGRRSLPLRVHTASPEPSARAKLRGRAVAGLPRRRPYLSPDHGSESTPATGCRPQPQEAARAASVG